MFSNDQLQILHMIKYLGDKQELQITIQPTTQAPCGQVYEGISKSSNSSYKQLHNLHVTIYPRGKQELHVTK